MSYESLQYTINEMAAYIILNRPDRLNSFDMKLGHELYDVLQDVAKNPTVKAVVIKGTGKGFCGGGDVNVCCR
jgi:2-(1,2-epoxy-1,2-dihydrophenyl)acetyl-CoA isomerase